MSESERKNCEQAKMFASFFSRILSEMVRLDLDTTECVKGFMYIT